MNTAYVSWMHILKAEDTWNLLNIIKYIVHLCERNSEIIQYKFEAFPETRVTFYTKIPGRFFFKFWSWFFFTKTSSYYLIRIMNY